MGLGVGKLGLLVLLVLGVASAIALITYSMGLLTPSIVVKTMVNGRPVNAYVQVFALLPPGFNRSAVEVWNGTAVDGVARVPIGAFYNVAREWVNAGYGSSGVGFEVFVTYVNGSRVYYDMHFYTYNPSDLVNTVNNPLISAIRLNYMAITMNATMSTSIAKATQPQSAPSPPPSPIGCWWKLINSAQTGTVQIPIAWVIDNAYNQIGGELESIQISLTTASVNFIASAGITKGASASVTYKFIGSATTSSNINLSHVYFGSIAPSTPQVGYLYVLGTLGEAVYQLVCLTTGGTSTVAYEAYVQSTYVQSNVTPVYASNNQTYITNIVNEYSKLTGSSLQYVPFDEAAVYSGSSTWAYAFSYVQSSSSPWGFTGVIPVGFLLALVYPEATVIIPPFVLANLGVSVQVTNAQISIIYISLSNPSPTYADVLATALPVKYVVQGGWSFYPYLLGFEVNPLGSYSSSTNITVDGPTLLVQTSCLPPPNYWNYTVYVYIGNSPLLVPGGTVSAILTDSSGNVVWSGDVQVPPSNDLGGPNSHVPAIVSIPSGVFNYGYPSPNTYYLTIAYLGYQTPMGSIYYEPSPVVKLAIQAEYYICPPMVTTAKTG